MRIVTGAYQYLNLGIDVAGIFVRGLELETRLTGAQHLVVDLLRSIDMFDLLGLSHSDGDVGAHVRRGLGRGCTPRVS